MKKLTALFLMTLLTASLLLGCGGSEEVIGSAEMETEITASEETVEEKSTEETVKTADAEETADGEEMTDTEIVATEEGTIAFNGTLEEFFATEEGKIAYVEVEEAIGTGEGDGFVMELQVEDNIVTFTATFDEGLFEGADIEALKTSISTQLEAQGEAFADSAELLDSYIATGNCTFVVRYLYEGEVLAESSYSAGE